MTFDIKGFTEQKLKEYDVADYSVAWNNRKRAHGLCEYSKKQISFSRYTIPHLTEAQQKAVALHEVAHAIVGPSSGHSKVWRDMCLAIGGDGERLGPSINAKDKFAKWIAECPNCKKTRKEFRRGNYACGKCCKQFNGGRYTDKFKLVYRPRTAM